MSTRPSFVREETCATCIFRPGNLMRLRKGRVREMVRDCLREQTHVVCHDTLDRPPHLQQACKGFADRYDTDSIQVGTRLDALFRSQGR